MTGQPDATLKFSDAEARLFLRAKRLSDGGKELDFDQLIVRHTDGREENVFIYDRGGLRKLGRITAADTLELLSPEDEKRLWGIYDRLLINVAA